MRLEVGPMSSVGATEWVGRARDLAAGLRGPKPELPFAVPAEVIDQFDQYFDEWERAAESDPFHWVTEIDAEVFRALMTYWLNLTQYLVEHPEARRSESDDAVSFYRRLSAALLRALSVADPDTALFEERWPTTGR